MMAVMMAFVVVVMFMMTTLPVVMVMFMMTAFPVVMVMFMMTTLPVVVVMLVVLSANLLLFFILGRKTVSYTHLDVYKRQSTYPSRS